ncbi:hypothetical protein C0J56_00665 [Pseudomonas fluorescens]|nr:hypothetical protein C0J56_00665 [Pseudomonas fluorescens]
MGASLLAKAVCQATSISTDLAPSRASPLPQVDPGSGTRFVFSASLLWERACSRWLLGRRHIHRLPTV